MQLHGGEDISSAYFTSVQLHGGEVKNIVVLTCCRRGGEVKCAEVKSSPPRRRRSEVRGGEAHMRLHLRANNDITMLENDRDISRNSQTSVC